MVCVIYIYTYGVQEHRYAVPGGGDIDTHTYT